MPTPAARKAVWSERMRVARAVAAGLIVGIGLWGGATTIRIGSRTAAVKHDVSASVSAPARPGDAPGLAVAAPSGVASAKAKGPMAWVRQAVINRAAVELTDSFQAGMAAWGMAPKSWAPGWSHHPDGYVRTGELALFRPSLGFQNYRLEFFAQIEQKSIGWVVRARDKQNYHAMKFSVVDPGLRPVIAMVHYPVVGGKAGRRVEIPLNVMVHNNEPYRMAVEVRGNRVITSIEGQEVDSWVDNRPGPGGIGFFSEAGERARLYWMKVAVNNDFLGRVCAYVSGALESNPQSAAAIWPSAPTSRAPMPAAPASPREAMLVAAIGFFRNRRMHPWMS